MLFLDSLRSIPNSWPHDRFAWFVTFLPFQSRYRLFMSCVDQASLHTLSLHLPYQKVKLINWDTFFPEPSFSHWSVRFLTSVYSRINSNGYRFIYFYHASSHEFRFCRTTPIVCPSSAVSVSDDVRHSNISLNSGDGEWISYLLTSSFILDLPWNLLVIWIVPPRNVFF